mmetsp:Transcript_11353/g.24634  ORF Transcript_11353/g.24634 Transcript_11353/m.24634 type:complete len:94 (-) Transcript_11353:39-320(-)
MRDRDNDFCSNYVFWAYGQLLCPDSCCVDAASTSIIDTSLLKGSKNNEYTRLNPAVCCGAEGRKRRKGDRISLGMSSLTFMLSRLVTGHACHC